MATGTIKWFAQGLLDLGNKIHNLSSDVLKLGIVTTATVPTLSTAAPHWGGTGTTNFATNQVGTGGTQYTGPKTLASVTWTSVSNVPTLRATDISMAQDASGFTTGAYGIIYNDTDANKRALGFIEINASGTASLVSGSLTIDWQGAGTDILTITQS
jgi:hypothetical protein